MQPGVKWKSGFTAEPRRTLRTRFHRRDAEIAENCSFLCKDPFSPATSAGEKSVCVCG